MRTLLFPFIMPVRTFSCPITVLEDDGYVHMTKTNMVLNCGISCRDAYGRFARLLRKSDRSVSQIRVLRRFSATLTSLIVRRSSSFLRIKEGLREIELPECDLPELMDVFPGHGLRNKSRSLKGEIGEPVGDRSEASQICRTGM